MRLVFDTSSLSKILDRDTKLIKTLSIQEPAAYVLPLAADAELRFGFKNGNREATNLDLYEHIKRDYGLEIALPDQDTAFIYADLAAYCRRHGLNLSNNDLWIAATCVQNAGRLLTLDKDFAALPQVTLVKL